jgi:lysophospholipase L1-like esterase
MHRALGRIPPLWLSALLASCAASPATPGVPDNHPLCQGSQCAQHPVTPQAPAAPSATRAPAAPAAPSSAAPRTLSPVYNAQILALRAKAQRRVLGDVPLVEDEHGRTTAAAAQGPQPDGAGASVVNGNALGRFTPIENEGSLAHFHRALENLRTSNDEDQKLRIVVYGASHTQGDLYTGYLRYYLQSRFGNGGQGFLQLAKLNAFYRTLDFKVDSDGFKVEHAQRKDAPEHGRFGLLGAAAVGRFPYAYARISPASQTDQRLGAERYELYFDAEPAGGDLKVKVGSEPVQRVSGRAEQPTARYHSFVRPLGLHQIEVRPVGNGPVRLFGLSAERSERGLVIDSLGINGTRAANMLRWDEPLWQEHLARRAPELVIVSYGTNEVTDTGEPIENYEANLRLVLTRLRKVVATQSCVLMGPGDFPKEMGEAWVERPRLRQIIEVQRKVAPDFDCGFWDTYAFMGGEGAMQRWVNARPALGSPDRIHFTARGYVRMGMAFGDALMRAYDEAHQGAAPAPPSPQPAPPDPGLLSTRIDRATD